MNSVANSINFSAIIRNLYRYKSVNSMNYVTRRRIYYFRKSIIINSTISECLKETFCIPVKSEQHFTIRNLLIRFTYLSYL